MTGQYALVQNNKVVSVSSLPSSYKNISGFSMLDDAEVAKYGFLPYTYTAPVFDATTHTLGDTTYAIGANAVMSTTAVRPFTERELSAMTSSLVASITSLLSHVLYNTDWTVLSDNNLSSVQATAYATLRAAIRTTLTKLGSLTVAQLRSLQSVSQDALKDSNTRSLVFSALLSELQVELSAL